MKIDGILIIYMKAEYLGFRMMGQAFKDTLAYIQLERIIYNLKIIKELTE